PDTSNGSPRPAVPPARRGSLPNVQQFDLEHQRGPGWDRVARAPRAIGQVGGDAQLAPPADAHAGHALVPAADHAPGAEHAYAWRAGGPRAVELRSAPVRRRLAVQPAAVVHADLVTRLRHRAGADVDVDGLEFRHVAAGVWRRLAA